MKKIASLFLISLLAACGSSAEDDVDGGNNPTFDGGNNPTFDAPPQANCLAANDVGSPTLANEGAQFCGTQATPDFVSYAGAVNADAQPDILGLQLYDGFGVFANGIVPGTYSITGDETQFATCGACVFLLTDFDGMNFADDGYLATGGTLTITSVSPLQGSVDGITFQHVEIDTMFMSTPHPDGCTSALTAASFDTETTMGSAQVCGG